MSFLQAAGVVIFIVGLCLVSFLFGLAVANAYHNQAERKSQKTVAAYRDTMREGAAIHAQALQTQMQYGYTLPERQTPFLSDRTH